MTMQFLDHDDPTWRTVAAGEPILAADRPLLTVEQWMSVRGDWPLGQAVAIAVPNTFDPAQLGLDWPRFSLVVLEFPKWTDGRAYSQARLLRGRYRFTADLRAQGDVLVDMAPLLHRTGFSSARLRDGQRVEVAQRTLGFFASHYQADARVLRPHFLREAA